jgi:hypothetical protein
VARWPSLQRREEFIEKVSAARCIEYENALRAFKLKKGQDPTELFDHITEVNTQYGIDSPDEKKLIALALEKLPEKYVNVFTTLSMGGNIDLEMFEETVKAIY